MTSWWVDQRARARLPRRPELGGSNCRSFTSCSMRASPTGSHFGFVQRSPPSLSIWFGCATCQAEDQQARGKRRKAYVVKNNAAACGSQRNRKEHQCWAQQVEGGHN